MFVKKALNILNEYKHVFYKSRNFCALVKKDAIEHTPQNQDFLLDRVEKKSPLEKCDEDISHVAPYLKPSFNFAAYVNKSDTLKELLKLGVDLYKLEIKRDVPEYILGLDFENDIKKHVMFLHEIGLSIEEVGEFITKCPLIFKEDLDDLVVRINYLRFKKFTNEMVIRIVTSNPAWLTFSTQEIDNRLGYFQKEYSLTGNEVRFLATKKPKLITYNLRDVKVSTFVVKEEMGFSPEETKQILLRRPNIFTKNQNNLLKTFEFIHRNMNVSLEQIAQTPEVLTCRAFRVRERHLFLEKLGKAQYNPKQPNYISLVTLVSGTDEYFSTEVAKSSVQMYNMFLKTL